MGLPRSPGPSTSAAPVSQSGDETVAGPSSGRPPTTVPPTARTGTDSSPEPDIVRFFCQEAERLHTAATVLTTVTEDMLRDNFRQLTKSKSDLDAANMAGSISKGAYLTAEKRYGQTRTAVIQKVKSLNPQVKTLTDLLRHDIVPRNNQGVDSSGRTSKRPASSRRRSSSRSPHMPPFSPSVGFRPVHPQGRGRSVPTDLLYSVPPTSTMTTTAPFAPVQGALGSIDPSLLAGPYGPLLLQGLLYQQQQVQPTVRWQTWDAPTPQRQDPREAAASDPNLGPLLSVISQREASRGQGTSSAIGRAPEAALPAPRSVGPPASLDEEEAYFAKEYGREKLDLTSTQFPEGWRYPSDRIFEMYFAKTDFLKAKKAGILKSFDGTIAGYPDFRLAFYKNVHVQRAPLLDKITTLDSLVPSRFFNEHFKGLDLTVHDYRLRIERLERQFGGEKRQLEHLLTKVGEFLRNPSGHSAKDLQGFVYTMESHFKKPTTHNAQKEVLATFLQVALPDSVRLDYHVFLKRDGKEETPDNFMSFLQHKIDAEVRNSQQKRVFYDDKRPLKRGKVMTGVPANDDGDQNLNDPGVAGTCQLAGTSGPCSYCKLKPHPLFRCFKFASASHEAKVRFVKEEGRCLKCLRVGHMVKDCTQVISCDFCDQPFEADHNRLLHKDPDPAQVATLDGRAPAYALRSERQLVGGRPVAAANMVLHLRCPSTGKEVLINALPDTGATDFVLDTSVADRLNLKGRNCQYTVLGHAGHETVHECIAGEIVAVNPFSGKEHPLSFFAYEGPCEGMYPENWARLKSNWKHLKDLDLPEPVEGRPFEAIIGCRYLALLEPESSEGLHVGKNSDDPVAKLTPLGWVMAGRTSSHSSGRVAANQGTVSGLAIPASGIIGDGLPPDYKKLYEQVKRNMERVWNLETEDEMRQLVNSYSPPLKTTSEMRAETLLRESLLFIDSEKRYEAALLWRAEDRPESNYARAKSLFFQLENTLRLCENKKKAFHETHRKWIDQGFLEEAPDLPEMDDQFFLPGFMVKRETTHETSYRFVMNGAKEFKGKSLNDFLLPGPNKMNNLADVLLLFRRHPHVLTCDIRNMFLGIQVSPNDREYLKVFYRPSEADDLRIYRCTRHVFGLCCSPFVAMSVVLHHARKSAHSWPSGLPIGS